MTPPNFALCFIYLFMASVALQQSAVIFESANIGDSVTLECRCQDVDAVMLYWYKQTLGQKPELMSTYYTHNNNGTFTDGFRNKTRFSLDTNRKNNLKISHLHILDSANYYCVHSNLYEFEFCEGTTLSVKGSGVNIQAVVQQSESEIIQPGGSVTLNCTVHTGTCDGGHSVYWFKDAEQSPPGLLYTHRGKDDICKRKSEIQARTCVYNLPMEKLNHSHAGTYYCAVASCGHIVFGNGTKLVLKDDVSSLLVYVLCGALSVTTILVAFLACSVYKMYKRNCHCTDSAVSTSNTEFHHDTENLHYAALKAPMGGRSRRQRDDTLNECVYSGVRQ